MGNFISSNSGSAKMDAMQEALSQNPNIKVKMKIKIKPQVKNEKPTGNAKRTNKEDRDS